MNLAEKLVRWFLFVVVLVFLFGIIRVGLDRLGVIEMPHTPTTKIEVDDTRGQAV